MPRLLSGFGFPALQVDALWVPFQACLPAVAFQPYRFVICGCLSRHAFRQWLSSLALQREKIVSPDMPSDSPASLMYLDAHDISFQMCPWGCAKLLPFLPAGTEHEGSPIIALHCSCLQVTRRRGQYLTSACPLMRPSEFELRCQRLYHPFHSQWCC